MLKSGFFLWKKKNLQFHQPELSADKYSLPSCELDRLTFVLHLTVRFTSFTTIVVVFSDTDTLVKIVLSLFLWYFVWCALQCSAGTDSGGLAPRDVTSLCRTALLHGLQLTLGLYI